MPARATDKQGEGERPFDGCTSLGRAFYYFAWICLNIIKNNERTEGKVGCAVHTAHPKANARKQNIPRGTKPQLIQDLIRLNLEGSNRNAAYSTR